MTDLTVQLASTSYDNLIVGGFDVLPEAITVASGENLVRGAVVGRVTADGKIRLADTGNVDGSETAYAVLLDDVDASAADRPGIIARTGVFNQRQLTFGTGHDETTQATIDQLEARMIFMRDSAPA